ncbi:MAG: 2-amino-4-hydroxy-6-hydroxymethyldihydropteridine diphosphokinase [Rikenellaceae bacterium]
MSNNYKIAVLSLGGNIGDKEENFKKVKQIIPQKIGEITQLSSIHQSQAWGFESSDIFFNQVVVVNTQLEPEELLFTIWEIERMFGRQRASAQEELKKYNDRLSSERPIYHSRAMDIDILYYNNQTISTELLKIPHPHIKDREFILKPLGEISDYF